MKKLESILKGLPGHGIISPFVTFPRFLFGLPSLLLPKKFTMNGGEGTITAMKIPIELAFSRQKNTKFDMTFLYLRRIK